MNLLPLHGRDFWRDRRLAAVVAWLLSRAIRPLRRHFERVFRRRFAAFQACVGQLVRDMPRQQVKWRRVMSSTAPAGDFFLCEDESVKEVRLVNDVCAGATPPALWKGRLTGWFPFSLRSGVPVRYSVSAVPGGQRLVYRGGRPWRWIMLVSKGRLPPVYAMEFDYTPHTAFREQLQFDFLMRSLHQRFRFMLRHNERFVFSVIDGGFFAPDSRSVPFSFKLGETARVRFEIVHDVFTLIVDGSVVMSVGLPGVEGSGEESCALIFYDQEPDVLIDLEIANFSYEVQDGQC